MSKRRWHRWLLGAALIVSLSGRTGALQGGPASYPSAPVEAPCASTKESVQRVLARRLGELSVHDETVASVAARLQKDAVPLSFIARDEDLKISFAMSRPTVQEVLETIVKLAPAYRYATIADHLVLYPRGTTWETRLEGVHLGPGPRDRVAVKLTDEVERRLPGLAHFGTFLSGNHSSYVFQDTVSVAGSGSVVELLVQLLGVRPSAIFVVAKVMLGIPWPLLFLDGVATWQTIKLTSPTTLLHPGEMAQLKVIGTLLDATRQDVTAGACGTEYWVSDERVVTVSADGLVTARNPGAAWVQARNADEQNILSIQVAKSGSSVTKESAAAPPPR